MKSLQPFTPVDHATDKRLDLLIDVPALPRGRRWRMTVTDVRTGKRYRAWQKSCGLPGCLCDAFAEEVD